MRALLTIAKLLNNLGFNGNLEEGREVDKEIKTDHEIFIDRLDIDLRNILLQ